MKIDDMRLLKTSQEDEKMCNEKRKKHVTS